MWNKQIKVRTHNEIGEFEVKKWNKATEKEGLT